ncbi:MAG TPA: hypothetical protein VFZ51_06885 [Woeseiaceae bacterium]
MSCTDVHDQRRISAAQFCKRDQRGYIIACEGTEQQHAAALQSRSRIERVDSNSRQLSNSYIGNCVTAAIDEDIDE